MKGLGAWGWGLAVAAMVIASGPAKAGHYVRGPNQTSVVSGFSRTVTADAVPVVSGFSRTVNAADDAVRKQLAGEWTLVKYEIFGENGQTRPGNYDIGRINYGDKEMSAHLMRSGRPKDAPATEAARAAAYQGYLGYFGPYTIDAEKEDRRSPRRRLFAAELAGQRAGAPLRLLERRQAADAVAEERRPDHADAHLGANGAIEKGSGLRA